MFPHLWNENNVSTVGCWVHWKNYVFKYLQQWNHGTWCSRNTGFSFLFPFEQLWCCFLLFCYIPSFPPNTVNHLMKFDFAPSSALRVHREMNKHSLHPQRSNGPWRQGADGTALTGPWGQGRDFLQSPWHSDGPQEAIRKHWWPVHPMCTFLSLPLCYCYSRNKSSH